MTRYTLSADDNFVIVSANSGGGGWKMARLSCCYENVYWYKYKSNGEYPWTMPEDYTCTERKLAKNHFDRILPDGKVVPLFGERVSRFWDDDAWMDRWRELYANLDLPDGKLVSVSHDSPFLLRKWFPNAFIINLYEEDSKVSADWHLQTSSNYRINHHFSGMRPEYKNAYAKKLDHIIVNKPWGEEATFKDIWLYDTHRLYEWTDDLYEEYKQHEYYTIGEENRMRKHQSMFCDINTTWDEFDVTILEPALGKINKNYGRVFSNPRFF